MRLTVTGSGPPAQLPAPSNRMPSLLERVPKPTPATRSDWPNGTEADWRARAEAHLIALEERHRAALEQIGGLRATCDALAARIAKGREIVAEHAAAGGAVPAEWARALDGIEIEYAARMADLYEATGAVENLGELYARSLEDYERRICAEEGRSWA